MAFDPDKLPQTRQGVRNLNGVGNPIRTQVNKKWTCPPHIPSKYWEEDEWRTCTFIRCEFCEEILETKMNSYY